MMCRPNHEKCVISAIPQSTIKSMCRSGSAYIKILHPLEHCLKIALVRVCLIIECFGFNFNHLYL